MRRFLLVASVLFVIWQPAQAQVYGGSAASFQTLDVNAYALGLGKATVALRGYPGAANVNPATIGRPNVVQVSSNVSTEGGLHLFTPWPLEVVDLDYWITQPSLEVGFGDWAGGYQLKRFDLGRTEVRDPQNNVVEELRRYEQSHKLTLAYGLRNRWSVGGSVSMIESRLGPLTVGSQREEVVRTVALDLGVHYAYPIRTPVLQVTPSAGWSLTDFGPGLKYGDTRDPLPQTMRAGLGVQVATTAEWLARPIARVGFFGSMTKELAAYDEESGEAYGPFRALFGAWDLKVQQQAPSGEFVLEDVSLSDQLARHRGLSIAVLDVLTLRWGKENGAERLGGFPDFSMRGWGVDLYYVALDFAHVEPSGEGILEPQDYWRLTARVPIGPVEDNLWTEVRELFRER